MTDDTPDLPETLAMWTCIGCGAMGNAEPCEGKCAFRKVLVVTAQDYADLFEWRMDTEAQRDALLSLIRDLATNVDDDAAFERAYPQLRALARAALRSSPAEVPPGFVTLEERALTWVCATCGQVDAPQSCLGVCIRRNGEFVRTDDYDKVAAIGEAARDEAKPMAFLARQLAWTTPRAGEWERARRLFRDRMLKLQPASASA